MGIFWAGLGWFVGVFLAKIVFRVLFTIGLGYVSYKGFSELVQPWLAQIQTNTTAIFGFGEHAAYAITALRVVPSIALIVGALQLALAVKVLSTIGRRALPKS